MLNAILILLTLYAFTVSHTHVVSSFVNNNVFLFRSNTLIIKSNLISSYSQQRGSNTDNHKDKESTNSIIDGIRSPSIRLNKVFKATHSRREADRLIESGRVSVNGKVVSMMGGMKVIPFQDEVSLDGKIIRGWERMNAINDENNNNNIHNNTRNADHNNNLLNTDSFEYVKYYKPLGVTCTTDLRIKDNIIDSIKRAGYNPKHRVYPVGRLDKETSGLIILTSDGRMVNAVLRGEKKQPKVYKVMVNGRLQENDLQQLRVSTFRS